MLDRLDWATAVQLVASMVQAAAAVLIFRLTRSLVDATKDYARSANAQVEATGASTSEARRLDDLGSAPLLDIHRPWFVPSTTAADLEYGGEPQEARTDCTVVNVGGIPAIDVMVSMIGQHGPKQPESNVRARSPRLPVLAPGAAETIGIPAQDARNAGPDAGPVKEYSHDWWIVRVECSNSRGVRVIQEYEWKANAADSGTAWRITRVEITPTVGDPTRWLAT